MKVCIYNEPFGSGMGGSEVAAAVLAEALSREHEVELVHYRPAMTRDALARFASVDLKTVNVRFGPPLSPKKGPSWKVGERLRAEQMEEGLVSAGADVFIALVHESVLFHRAPYSILYVLFPICHPGNSIPRRDGKLSRLRNHLQRLWYRWKLTKRLRNYDVYLAISEFSRVWTKARWKVEPQIIYPPVEISGTQASPAKTDLIVSVGRFAVGGHEKKQLEMLSAFHTVKNSRSCNWHYISAGSCGQSTEDCAFAEKSRELCRETSAEVRLNVTRDEIRNLYAYAKIFWHAAGMGVDQDVRPELVEHFGITTVEAMAAGCVPVVINRGGQPEIVEHGVSGFLWNTIEELQSYTLTLMDDELLRERMSAAAQAKAEKFSRKRFVNAFVSLVDTWQQEHERTVRGAPTREPRSNTVATSMS